MKTNPIYNTIGRTYDTTRRADPDIVQTLLRLLQPKAGGQYIDVACGSGNYTDALSRAGLVIEGVDISEAMLAKARLKNPAIAWHQGDAQGLPFKDRVFDGVVCTLATHHMEQFEQVFNEMYRVMKPGRSVILTSTPEQMQHYWLCHYFPMMMEDAWRRMSSLHRIEQAYRDAGFVTVRHEPFFVTKTCSDWFLYAGKYRPEMYLDPAVRAGISSFHMSASKQEITTGLARLEVDIASGAIAEVIQRYENEGGDYMFVVGEL